MNQITLVGRICRPIELKQVNGQHQVVNNAIAVSRNFKDRNGELVTDFIPFVVWDNLAKVMFKYAQKGQRIAISGMMQSRKYTNKEDQEVFTLECIVRELTLLDRPHAAKQIESSIAENDKGAVTAQDVQISQELVSELVSSVKSE